MFYNIIRRYIIVFSLKFFLKQISTEGKKNKTFIGKKTSFYHSQLNSFIFKIKIN